MAEKTKKNTIVKIDGIKPIIDVLKTDDEFIKLAVKSSYFFDPDLKGIRLKDEEGHLYARQSKDKENYEGQKIPQKGDVVKFVAMDPNIFVRIDKDGNTAVRKLINDTTGYTICQGKTSIFQNYNLSHVWGNAYDPRYFTSLWNIVVIPSWANHLMDKEASEQGSIASKMKNTYKKICDRLYFEDFNWEKIGLKGAPEIPKYDIVEGTYKLNIIKQKGNKVVGSIIPKDITISTK